MSALDTSDMFLFERFRLDRRGLFWREKSGGFVPIKIGSRAEEILWVLIKRAGDLVSKDEIIAKVWPGTIVEESNLTVQISTLRRFLDERSAHLVLHEKLRGSGADYHAVFAQLRVAVDR